MDVPSDAVTGARPNPVIEVIGWDSPHADPVAGMKQMVERERERRL